MQRILSTYRYVNQPLLSELLASIASAGIQAIEVFCSSGHFGYSSPQTVREFVARLDEYGIKLQSLHAPTERSSGGGRSGGAPISISDPERIRRVDAMDEVKRALEVAETIPFRYLIQHMATSHQPVDPRTLDAAFSSLEHLVLFAKQRGVVIAIENTPNEFGSPESLAQFVKQTRLNDLRFCFDLGHAHIAEGVAAGFELLRDRTVTVHVHDNHGETDEHLLPFDGTIDWGAALGAITAVREPPAVVLELKERSPGVPSLEQIRTAFDKLEKHWDEKGVSAAHT
ncbi:MAG TPA: sugar phosphate isomerase/epimerase family protein [Candidatus Acidoferrales bacterium]|nr:sugar phosphate isomerase/epimerase family protein [Candidatus Acidoferrales bacterium]